MLENPRSNSWVSTVRVHTCMRVCVCVINIYTCIHTYTHTVVHWPNRLTLQLKLQQKTVH